MLSSQLFKSIIHTLPPHIFELIAALLLGLFIGLEREWSNKPAGIRTFALTATIGVVFAFFESEVLLVSGVLFIIILAVLLGISGILGVRTDTDAESFDDESYGLALTTSVSLLVTYSIGVLMGYGFYSEAVTIAVLSSALLALKKELHNFAWGLTRDEVRSAIEFAIIAFVIYPLLPTEPVDPWGVVDLQLVWLLVIAISSIGFINYILAQKYEGKSFLITGFLGGLVNSTAVIVSVASRATERPELKPVIVGSILLANSAMALRNAAIVFVFNPTEFISIIPLLTITILGLIFTYYVTSTTPNLENDLSSPFSLRNALTFGGLFLGVLLLSGIAQQFFGEIGFLATAFVAGFVSSGTSTSTAITLFSQDAITFNTLTLGVLFGTIASILVKIAFAAKVDRNLVRPVVLYNGILTIAGLGVATIIYFI